MLLIIIIINGKLLYIEKPPILLLIGLGVFRLFEIIYIFLNYIIIRKKYHYKVLFLIR